MKLLLLFLISALPSIVPQPVSVRQVDGGSRIVRNAAVTCRDAELEKLPVLQVLGGLERPSIILSCDGRLEEEEYILDTSHRKVRITGGSPTGVWWGVQTLVQILAQNEGGTLPGLVIQDKPALPYRGAHLDCSRHFFSVGEIERFIDMLSLHKMNRFHWHPVDNQSWRLELDAFPELAAAGRDSYNSNEKFSLPAPGGTYSKEDMRRIVEYAAVRGVTVIPEIEVPGHSKMVVSVHPELGCSGRGEENALCAAKEETFDFFEKVLDEICGIFPSEYIHLGGDEVNYKYWNNCPACRSRMKELGLETPQQLQSYVMKRMENYLASKGRKMIAWAEVLDGEPSLTTTIMPWRYGDNGKKSVSGGFDTILTQCRYYYMNYHQTSNPDWNGEPYMPKPNVITLRSCYEHDACEGFSPEEKTHLVGLQTCLWTEYVLAMDTIERDCLPRMAAVSENAWAPDRKSSYDDFVLRMKNAVLPVYRLNGYHYSDFAFRPVPVE